MYFVNKCEGQHRGFSEVIQKRIQNARINRKCYCERHQNNCNVPLVDVVGGGTPCTDWSTAGLKKGLDGLTALPTYAWMGLALKSRVAIHENVVGFPNLLEAMGGAAGKKVTKFTVEPAHGGFGKIASRKRKYRVMVEDSMEPLADPHKVYNHLKACMANDSTVEDILEASTPEDVKEELGPNSSPGTKTEQNTNLWRVVCLWSAQVFVR